MGVKITPAQVELLYQKLKDHRKAKKPEPKFIELDYSNSSVKEVSFSEEGDYEELGKPYDPDEEIQKLFDELNKVPCIVNMTQSMASRFNHLLDCQTANFTFNDKFHFPAKLKKKGKVAKKKNWEDEDEDES